MKEKNISVQIQQAASPAGHRLFVNARGRFQDARSGNWISFGLGPNGAGDLVGWQSIVITPDMVGQRFARFASIEVKKPGEEPREDQERWRDGVNKAGGVAGVATSPDEALAILRRQA